MQRPKWLIRSGSVKADQIPGWTERAVRGLSLSDLLTLMEGFYPNSLAHRLCELELRRRESWVPRWALGVSILALAVAVAAIILKLN